MRPHPRTTLVRPPRARRRGFTLIELIVVIVILGILVAVGAFAYNSVISNSRQDAVRKTAAQVAMALQGHSGTKSLPYSAANYPQGVVDGIVAGDTDATVSAMVDDTANGYATVTVTRDGYSVEVRCPLGKVGVACRTGDGGSGGGPVPPVVDAAMRAVAVSSSDGMVSFSAIQMLPDGSAIVAGYASGTVTFGTHTITTADSDLSSYMDIVVAKLNPDGTWAWVSTAGGSQQDMTGGLAVDGSGNIYITATVSAATFGTLPGTYTGLAVAKLTPGGAWAWATTQDSGAAVLPSGIAVTPTGDLVVVGQIWGESTFGPDTLPDTGHNGLLVTKLTSSGTWLWARRSDGTDQDGGNKVAVDGSGNIYVAGMFKTSSMFGTHQVTGPGGTDAVLAKLNPAGTWQWATAVAGPGYDYIDDVAVTASGHLLVSGTVSDTGTFGTAAYTADSSGDAMVAKVDQATGDPVWVSTGGGTGWDELYSVTTDGSGNIVVAGYTEADGTYGSLTVGGSGYSLIAKLSPAGDWTWVRRAGGNSYDGAYDVAVTPAGKIAAVGEFYDNATFGSAALTESGRGSGYVAWWDADGTQD